MNENIHSLGFRDITKGVTLRRSILRSLECSFVVRAFAHILQTNASKQSRGWRIIIFKCYNILYQRWPQALKERHSKISSN